MNSNVHRNPNFGKLQSSYVFSEIARRRKVFLDKNPDAKLVSLGIGDTTLPIPPYILNGLVTGATKLGIKKGYTGYGAEQGVKELREKIAHKLYQGKIEPEEVFVSDGAKCDIARLQMMFGSKVISAVQDPSYPVYVETAVMIGQTGVINETSRQFENILYMPCNPSNNFFPDVENLPRADIYYICSPNNPTGAVASRENLEALVRHAKKVGAIIVFDAAYAPFIRTPGKKSNFLPILTKRTNVCLGVPKSIFEIEGAKDVSIEVNSFSKYAGFTGVRLGWTVVPSQLKYADGFPVRNDWNRVMTTAFNGASNVAQTGGLACLDDEGLAEIHKLIDYYLDNAKMLRQTLTELGFNVYGGVDGPYVFVQMKGQTSWDAFNELLEKMEIVTVPGAGFGPGGEGFLRMSAFASKENCEEACRRFRAYYGKK